MFELIILIISLGLIMLLAYKGYSTIITAPLVGLGTVFIMNGFKSHLMFTYTEVYMVGLAQFVKSYFPLFLTGAIFAKLMEAAGYGKAIAHFITQKLGKKHALLSVVLSGALLTYGGVSLFVVAFILYPIANLLFQEANIPKRLIPGTIALGAFTFTMTALPGSPEIQNVIPMNYFGTDTFAAPLLGLLASTIMLSLGMFWLTYRLKKAQNANEGYGISSAYTPSNEVLPSTWKAICPILVIFLANLFFSKVFYERIDGSYLAKYNLSIESVLGTWSVIIAIFLGILFILTTTRFTNLKSLLNEGIQNAFLPLMSSSSIVGYGSIIKSLTVFTLIQEWTLSFSSNPIISEALSVNLICGITASASGGLGIALSSLASTYLDMANTYHISPEILHRIASLASGGLDTLPHNGAVITTLAICGLTHKDSYKDIFVTSVLIPIVTLIIIVAITIL